MALDFATSYAEIIKFNKNDDGTITVYGKATSDDLDIDQQICDNDWLSKAMPEWFKSGGNIREQHSSIAAGVAQELETKDDGYYVSAHIVDPTSIKKVEAKVLKGFSIGIKGPRVVRDNKAANGRIIDGQIVEVSLVDRPANPTCQLVLAKSVGGESTLTQVEEMIEKYNENQERDERGRFGSGGGSSSSSASYDTNRYNRDGIQEQSGEKLNNSQWKELQFEMEHAAQSARADHLDSGGKPGKAMDAAVNDAVLEAISNYLNYGRSANSDTKKSSKETIEKYNENQERDDHGRFGSGSGSTNNSDNAARVSKLREREQKQRDKIKDLRNQLKGNLHSSLRSDLQAQLNRQEQVLSNILTSMVLGKSEKMIEKGSPDQERDDHGRWSSGGGGSSSNPIRDKINANSSNPLSDNASAQIQSAYHDTMGMAHDVEALAKDDPTIRPASFNLSRATDYLQSAADAKTVGEARNSIFSARTELNSAVDALESQNYNIEASTAYSMAKDLNSLSVGIGTGAIKSLALHYNFTDKTDKEYETMKNALLETIVEMEKNASSDQVSFDAESYEIAQKGVVRLIAAEAGEESDDNLVSALSNLFAVKKDKSDDDSDSDTDGCSCDGCKACKADGGCDKSPCDKCMMTKSATIDKCLECGCHQVADNHGLSQVVVTGATPTNEVANVSTAVSLDTTGSIKSAEGEKVVAEETPAEEKAEELVDAELPTTTEILDEKSVTAIIEKAVKSATDTVKAEIAEYEAASKAANEKVMVLESELVAAKSAAIASGPKRTGRIAVTDTNELLLKAAEYRLKASATSDQILAKGYKALEKEYLEKAGTPKAE
jgi:hypothetical protein